MMFGSNEHLTSKVLYETLEDLEGARIEELVNAGYDEIWAEMFALLETERRKRLALEIGPRKALLARLKWTVDEDYFGCDLVYDGPPSRADTRSFHGFY